MNFINTGATATSVDSMMLNGVPTTDTGWSSPITVSTALSPGATCEIGVAKVGTITFAPGETDPSGNQLNPGVTLTINIHSTGGKDTECIWRIQRNLRDSATNLAFIVPSGIVLWI